MNTKGRYSGITTKLEIIKFEDVKILGQELGNGAFAKVYTVKYCGVTYAAKEIHELLQSGVHERSLEKRTLKENFIHECELCSRLSHPNIVHFIGIYYKPKQSLPIMVMETMDESLTSYAERLPVAAVKKVGPILLDVAEGLKYLHAQKPNPIVHLDLSPNNIMLLKDEKEITVAKIGDLGVARAIGFDTQGLSKAPGTLDFMPPEAFKDAPRYDTSLDVFSYGAVTLYVANHKWPTPVNERELDSTGNLVALTNEIQRRQIYLDRIEGEMENLKPLIKDCLRCNPNERPTMLKVSEELVSLKQKGILFDSTEKGRSELDKKCINSGSKNSASTVIATLCNDNPLKMSQRDTLAATVPYNRNFSAGSGNLEQLVIQYPSRVSATVSDKRNLSVNSTYRYKSMTKSLKDSKLYTPSTSASKNGVNVGNVNDSKDTFKRMRSHSEHYTPDLSVAGLSYIATVSVGSVQNEQYSLGTQPCSDHDNEDEFIVHSNKHSLCMCVFDGHDGPHAVRFVKKYTEKIVLGKPVWDDMTKSNKPEEIKAALGNYIQKADDNFFKSIEPFTTERQKLRSEIPKELTFQVRQNQMFPVWAARLKVLQSHISGGCTAVVALLTSDRLYIANVGNSRAILVYKENDVSLQVKQLSVDHSIYNEQELERLTALGLDREQLKKSGRLGTLENTRSIGDYMLKGGYKDVNVLSHATDQPGTAVPHVTSVNIDPWTFEYRYIILMSDGVYKTLEAIDGGDTKKSGNTLIVDMIEKHITEKRWNDAIAVNILQEICQTQKKLYQISAASKDAHSLTAVANNIKRNDMTLMICKFDFYNSSITYV